MILVSLGAVFVTFAAWSENWARGLLWLLIQLLVIAAPLLVLRLMGRRLVAAAPEREAGVSALRWSLKEMLVAITLATVYVALIRFLNFDGGQLGANAAIVPLVGLACVVTVFFAIRLWKLIIVVIVLESILTAIITWINFRSYIESVSDEFDMRFELLDQQLFFQMLRGNSIALSVIVAILFGSLLVVRSCGYRWARRDDETPRDDKEHPSSLIFANEESDAPIEEPRREND
jgi:hypothetical protein